MADSKLIAEARERRMSTYDLLVERVTSGLSEGHRLAVDFDSEGAHLVVVNEQGRPVAGWTAPSLHAALTDADAEVNAGEDVHAGLCDGCTEGRCACSTPEPKASAMLRSSRTVEARRSAQREGGTR